MDQDRSVICKAMILAMLAESIGNLDNARHREHYLWLVEQAAGGSKTWDVLRRTAEQDAERWPDQEDLFDHVSCVVLAGDWVWAVAADSITNWARDAHAEALLINAYREAERSEQTAAAQAAGLQPYMTRMLTTLLSEGQSLWDAVEKTLMCS